MFTLHLDTETDGLNVPGVPSDHPDQPNTLSLTAVLDDPEGVCLGRLSTLILPVRPVPAETTAIHGITLERAMEEGIPLRDAMTQFEALLMQADILVAYNIFYDFKMMKIACAKMGEGGETLRALLESKSSICTMGAARKFIGGKQMKLMAAHTAIIGVPFEGAHTSASDTMASRAIYYALKAKGALPQPKSMARKVYDTPAPGQEDAA